MKDSAQHMLRMISALFRTAHALRANDVETQTLTNTFLEHIIYYMNNALEDRAEWQTERDMIANEITHALAGLCDLSSGTLQATLHVPVDEGYYDNDYTYQYYLLYDTGQSGLVVELLAAPPAGGYVCDDLLGDHTGDVVVFHLTLRTNTTKCVNFNTYRIASKTTRSSHDAQIDKPS